MRSGIGLLSRCLRYINGVEPMPRYVYRCPKCTWRRECVHRMDEEPDVRCRNCDVRMVRVIQPVGFTTKGEGFESWGRA